MNYYGQALQDKYVLNVLDFKKNGFFLEIGSNDPIIINNSYILESEYNWRGILVEMDKSFLKKYKKIRPKSIPLIQDATKINYMNELQKVNAPQIIDYLQIDLEVNNCSTLKTLELLDNLKIFKNYKFQTITFEHDIYRKKYDKDIFDITREKSREIFLKHGYKMVLSDVSNENNPYEDWYVHPDIVNINKINKIINNNKEKYKYINKLNLHHIDHKVIEY